MVFKLPHTHKNSRTNPKANVVIIVYIKTKILAIIILLAQKCVTKQLGIPLIYNFNYGKAKN